MTRPIHDHGHNDPIEFDLSGFEALAHGIRQHTRSGGDPMLQDHFNFDTVPMRVIETPASRATDPQSSHDAEQEITGMGYRAIQMEQAVQAVHQYPGKTSHELAELTRMDRYALARRLPEAVTAGEVRKGEPRKCAVSGRKVTTWWPLFRQVAKAA